MSSRLTECQRWNISPMTLYHAQYSWQQFITICAMIVMCLLASNHGWRKTGTPGCRLRLCTSSTVDYDVVNVWCYKWRRTTSQCNLSFGSRAFRISAPKIWNSLPPYILQSQTLDSFRRHLKTYYFQSAIPPPIATIPNAPWFSPETLAIYKSLTYLLTYLLTYI